MSSHKPGGQRFATSDAMLGPFMVLAMRPNMPISTRLASSRTLRTVVRATLAVLAIPAPALAQQTTGAPRLEAIWKVGVENGTASETFAKIGAAAIDLAGFVYLLDTGAQVIHSFSPTGSFVGTYSRAGRGPGEMATPVTIRIDNKGELLLLDAANGIARFATRNGQLRLQSSTKLPFTGADLCFVGDTMYVLGAYQGKVVHRVSRSGAVVSSFGELFGPAHAVREVLNTRGRIACATGPTRIAVAPALLPEVRVYDGGERLRLAIPVPRFTSIVIQQHDGGAYSMLPRKQGFSENAVLRFEPDHSLFVQSQLLQRGSTVGIEACVAPPEGKRCVSVRGTLPLLMASHAGRIVVYNEEPFPSVTLARFAQLPK